MPAISHSNPPVAGPVFARGGMVRSKARMVLWQSGKGQRVILAPVEDMQVYDPSKPDPRLRELVRLLARQAARKFVEAEQEGATRDRLLK
jgi:hypothetical protein